jgi:hypothetical protein
MRFCSAGVSGRRLMVCARRQAPGGGERVVVDLRLLRRQRHVAALLDAVRQLVAHQGAVAAQHHRREPAAQRGEIAVAQHLAALVGDVEVHEIAPERPQHPRVHHLHQAVEVLQAVLQRGAAEHEGIARRDALDGGGDLGAPVLDALGLVQDQQVRRQGLVDDAEIAQHQLGVDDVEAAALAVLHRARLGRTLHQVRLGAGEARDLPLPLELEGGRADDQRPLDVVVLVQPIGGGDGLQRLAQAHVVGQQRAPAAGQEGAVGVEPPFQHGRQVGGDLRAPVQPDARGVVALPVQVDIGPRRRPVADRFEVLALADAVQHRLDVLAGAELVGGEVRAGAMVGALGQRADLHLPGGLDRARAGADGARPPGAAELHLVGEALELLVVEQEVGLGGARGWVLRNGCSRAGKVPVCTDDAIIRKSAGDRPAQETRQTPRLARRCTAESR